MDHLTPHQKIKKVILLTFIFNILSTLFPTSTWAQESVQYQTGDFSYNLPLMAIPLPGGSYPVSMFYSAEAAIKPQYDASWVGLGWNLIPGSISRMVKGFPDDWNYKTTTVTGFDMQWNADNGYGYNYNKPQRYGMNTQGAYKLWFISANGDQYGCGALYMNHVSHIDNSDPKFVGRQNLHSVGDVYSNPYSSDTYNKAVKQGYSNALSFPNYDSYSVSGPGIGGTMSPKIYQFGQLIQQQTVFQPRYNNGAPIAQLTYYDYPSYTFTKPREQIYFQFDYDASGYTGITSGQYHFSQQRSYFYTGGALQTANADNLNFYNSANNRSGHSTHVEYFTNDEIKDPSTGTYRDAVSRGFIETPSQSGGQRGNTSLYDGKGIGAFSITAADGTTYHYSVPVYQFEEIIYFQDNTSQTAATSFQESRNLNMYATDWLLTAITGPDFVDNPSDPNNINTKGTIGDEDYGYYVQFDYGKWTDGFIWRTPYEDGIYNPGPTGTTYQSYSFGRKQIYYLNSIKTKTHTAYFIKSLRLDGIGKQTITSPAYMKKITDLTTLQAIRALPCINAGKNYAGLYDATVQETEILDAGSANTPLKLDKIILLTNDDAKTYASVLTGNNNGGSKQLLAPVNGSFSINRKVTSVTVSYGRGAQHAVNVNCSVPAQTFSSFQSYYQGNVLDYKDLQDVIGNIESKALSVIEFNSGIDENNKYLLCNGTPNSISPATAGSNNTNTAKNKLTLKSVKTYGISKADILPPYIFTYKGEKNTTWTEIPYTKINLDNWGYYSYTPNDLSDKTTSVDTWALKGITTPNGAKISMMYESDTYCSEAVFGKLQYIINAKTTAKGFKNNTLKCTVDESVDSYVSKGWLAVGKSYAVEYDESIPNTYPQPPTINHVKNTLTLQSYTSNMLVFNYTTKVSNIRNTIFLTKIFINPDIMYGGGIRVKEIDTDDGANNIYSTSYTYNNPFTNITSGVTSYAPTKEDKYIPYVYEVPLPSVMYEYVTVANNGTTGQSNITTRYHFDVLKAATSSGPFAFAMADKIKVSNLTTVSDYSTPSNAPIHFSVFPRTAMIEDNKSAIGRVLEVVTMDILGHVQNRVTYQYYNLATDTYKNGISQETFGEIKDFTYWGTPDPRTGQQAPYNLWILTSSTRKMYPNLLKSITTQSKGITQTTTIDNYDFYTGVPLQKTALNNDGTKYTTIENLAFSKYGGIQQNMGSKVYGSNKNMLTQKSATYNYIVNSSNQLNLLSAGAQVWNNSWTYRDIGGSQPNYTLTDYPVTNEIWRQQKSYVWKSSINNKGVINGFIDFNFVNPANADSRWQKTNEITRYDHFSTPLEVKDVNGNYSSGKMCRNSRYSVASSNKSTYVSYTHSSFEDLITINPPFFEGEVPAYGGVQMASTSSIAAHTGNYLLNINSGSVSATLFGSSAIQKGITYRASVWVNINSPSQTYLDVVLTNSNGSFTEKKTYVTDTGVKQVGNWKLMTVDIIVPPNYSPPSSNNGLMVSVIKPSSANNAYVDDFRLQPVNSNVTGSVYDTRTGLLSAVLDNENFATFYTYDSISRLTLVRKETLNGVIPVKSMDYHIHQ